MLIERRPPLERVIAMSDLFKKQTPAPRTAAPARAASTPKISETAGGSSCCGGASHDAPASGVPHTASATDPVCNMSVVIATAKHSAEHDGKTYYFCCASCRTKFLADPQRYLSPPESRPATAAADPDAAYICPMCPEVRQIGPGTCPKCGMALEPEMVSLDAAPNPEFVDFKRRLGIGLAFTLPVFMLEMGGHVMGGHDLIAPSWSKAIQLVLATPVVLWAGWPFLERGWASLRTRNFNMFTLIALGTMTAWGYSLVATLLPGLFPPALRDLPGGPPVYFEAAAVITVLVLLGQVLELKAREQTGDAIRSLLKLAPERALRVRVSGGDEEVALDAIDVGDRLRVRPGDTVPIDGIIVEGVTQIDQSMVTGEPMPAAKSTGDAVIGGTINGSGGFVMRAEKVGRDTLLARIVQSVSEAQRSRAPVQRLADSVAGWFVPLVVAAAVLAFLAWWQFGPEPRFAYALVAAVSVLVIACPCALGLATPMSIMVGLGRGAASGVLFRSADALERFETVDTLIVDKTGTLTEGRPAVASIHTLPGFDVSDVLRLAASVERSSKHPLALAVLAEAEQRGLTLDEPSDVVATAGKGVSALVGGRRMLVGNRRFLGDAGIETAGLDALAADHAAGTTPVYVVIDGVPAAMIAVADRIKDAASAAITSLRALGVRVVMLTGDVPGSAAHVARQLGITEFEGGMLPDDKARYIQRLKSEGRVVAMAGDGINDAPALAAADVGIAMGTGSGIAIESAGVTLVGGDLAGLARARRLSVATMRNIRQNLVFAFAYNAAGVPIAAGVLYPVLGILLSPIVAAAAMSLSSVSVIANALRLRFVSIDG